MPRAVYPRQLRTEKNYSAENCVGSCEVVIVPNCDHFYVGAEDRVSKIVTDWLEKMVG